MIFQNILQKFKIDYNKRFLMISCSHCDIFFMLHDI